MKALVPLLIFVGTTGLAQGQAPVEAVVANAREEQAVSVQTRAKLEVAKKIIQRHCVECHGPEKQKNGLRVDSLSALIQGGKSGPAISPGKPEESLLIHAVRRMDEDLKMPPKVPLAKHEMDNLALWIRNGSVWPSGSAAIIEK